jgi:hypothetical protein
MNTHSGAGMHSFSFHSADRPGPEKVVVKKSCARVDQYSQAVLSFMYEAGLLIVSGDDNVVTVLPDCALASCQEVPAYDEAHENASAVEALGRLEKAGLTECKNDDYGRRLYRLSLKGRLKAQSICYRQRP